jgi:transcriptional regulator with XRE-family HTH domain
METPGALLAAARKGAGLSMHALARKAGVAYTTVSRIEHGQVDPTTSTLERLLAAAGMQLELAARPVGIPQLADLSDAWRRNAHGQDRPDWTRIRVVLDHLAQHPGQTGAATRVRPTPSGSEFMDNLLAGIAEKLCDDAGVPRPAWTKRVRALRERWEGSGTPRMQAEARAVTPRQLAERGITVRADSLWREVAEARS